MNDLQMASIVVGLIGAVLWFIAAICRVPSQFHQGYGGTPELEPLLKSLKRQSLFNAAAALATALAIVLQVVGSIQAK